MEVYIIFGQENNCLEGISCQKVKENGHNQNYNLNKILFWGYIVKNLEKVEFFLVSFYNEKEEVNLNIGKTHKKWASNIGF